MLSTPCPAFIYFLCLHVALPVGQGAEGLGAPDRVPPLANSVGRFLEVEGGREYLVQVPGVAMAPLNDKELADVLNWVAETYAPSEFLRSPTRFTASEVARYRTKIIDDVSARRSQLLDAYNARSSTGPAN